VSVLRSATPEEYEYLIGDMFETITLYDNRIEKAVSVPTEDGRYRVTLSLLSKKMRSDGKGVETEVPEDDWIEIGVYGEKGDADEAPFIYLEKRRVASGASEIELILDKRPVRAGIDPRHLLIDRVPGDNVKRLAGGGQGDEGDRGPREGRGPGIRVERDGA
jgi:ABC-2 type transport system permease protein